MDSPQSFEELVRIMDRLREPGGCPWDREQTLSTLRGYLLEECYEVVEALDRSDLTALREELGDLLFQIVFLSRLANEAGRFTATDVVRGIGEKIIRRHPHVFGTARAESSEEVLRNWEEIKRREKEEKEEKEGVAEPERGERSLLSGVPRALPALLKAHRLGTKAARVGFDWKGPAQVIEKVDEEMAELRAAVESGDRTATREELGDLLFTLVMLSRHLEVDPEEALERANRKFQERFARVEAELARRGVRVQEAGLELMESLWRELKPGGR